MRFFLVIVMGLWVLPSTTWAAPNLYSAKTPVASQSATDRNLALSEALNQVLIKVSGDLSVRDHEALQALVANAAGYVVQYRYLQNKQSEQGQAGLLLKADFEPARVEQLLKQHGFSVWPANRPDVLVWLIEDTPETGRQVVADRQHPLLQGILQRANERGVPTLLPLWDLDDQFMLPQEELWALNENAVLAASARYDVSTVLVGRYSQTSAGTWLGAWQFLHQGDAQYYEYTTQFIEELAAAAIDPLVITLAERYAVSQVGDEGEQLQVIELQGINRFDQYRQVLGYLESRPQLSKVQLVAMDQQVLRVHALLSSSWQQFNDALRLDRKLAPLDSYDQAWQWQGLGAPNKPARYQWQGQ